MCVGNIVFDLFGVLDSRFEKKRHQDDLSNIESNEDYLMQLYKNQMSVVEISPNNAQYCKKKKKLMLLDITLLNEVTANKSEIIDHDERFQKYY